MIAVSMKTCTHCRRESCGTCDRCKKNEVCNLHDGVDVVVDTVGRVVATKPVCVACRWGNA